MNFTCELWTWDSRCLCWCCRRRMNWCPPSPSCTGGHSSVASCLRYATLYTVRHSCLKSRMWCDMITTCTPLGKLTVQTVTVLTMNAENVWIWIIHRTVIIHVLFVDVGQVPSLKFIHCCIPEYFFLSQVYIRFLSKCPGDCRTMHLNKINMCIYSTLQFFMIWGK